jgi:hypothetical protein
MKRRGAWIFAILSGLYLLVVGPLPDPLPLIDEATALLVFVNCMGYLGYDVRRWLAFLGRLKRAPPAVPKNRADATIDV